MTKSTEPSIVLKSNLGYALMLQVISAVSIIGGLTYFGPFSFDLVSFILIILLYAIGFIQLLVTRYVMQREKYGVLVAIGFAIITLSLSFSLAVYWWEIGFHEIQAFFYFAVGTINVHLTVFLRKVKSESVE
ncbi:MAG: hypothetical protein ACFFFK_02080 [Candidatus Thorarchaeota archaeon]